MATFQKFEQIEAWQRARELTKKLYKITRQGAFTRDFGLRNQIRDASVSIMSNIAEGYERSGSGEFAQLSWRLQKDQPVRSDRSCTSLLIKNTLTTEFFRYSPQRRCR